MHELNKPNEFSIGQILRVSAKHIYSDLDELIVSHVKSMARKVDELTSHEKYRGSESELGTPFRARPDCTDAAADLHLQNVTMANPGTSAYGFAINSKPGKGGQFMLSFRTSHTAEITSWVRPPPLSYFSDAAQPVKIMPGVFMLMNEEHGDVLSLVRLLLLLDPAYAASSATRLRRPTRARSRLARRRAIRCPAAAPPRTTTAPAPPCTHSQGEGRLEVEARRPTLGRTLGESLSQVERR